MLFLQVCLFILCRKINNSQVSKCLYFRPLIVYFNFRPFFFKECFSLSFARVQEVPANVTKTKARQTGPRCCIRHLARSSFNACVTRFGRKGKRERVWCCGGNRWSRFTILGLNPSCFSLHLGTG